MSPLILLLGFLVGGVTLRLRTLAPAILALGLAWGCLVIAGGSLDDLPGAFVVGAANGAVGIVVGSAVRILILGPSLARRAT